MCFKKIGVKGQIRWQKKETHASCLVAEIGFSHFSQKTGVQTQVKARIGNAVFFLFLKEARPSHFGDLSITIFLIYFSLFDFVLNRVCKFKNVNDHIDRRKLAAKIHFRVNYSVRVR